MYFGGFLRYDRKKKKFHSSVWRKKNRYSRLSVGCAVLVITTGKKKIQSSVWRVVLYVVSVFGSGGKLAVFLLWRENFITTGKKKKQSSVWRVRDQLRPENKKDTVVCLLGARFWQLRPEKKEEKKRYNRHYSICISST